MKTCAHRFVLALLLIASTAASARAAGEGPSRLDGETQRREASMARLEVQPSRVDWLLNAEYEYLSLTVAGPGDFYLRRELGPGQTPYLDLAEHRLADGSYAYELRAVSRPDPTKLPGEEWALREAPVQSGHLWVREGSFVANVPPPPSKPAPPSRLQNVAQADVVHPDDLIVQGQACIGADCVNGDADSGPVLLLKDNLSSLLQIKFDQTDCCHPSTRDWAIQANDWAAADGDFTIRDLTAGTIPFRISGHAPDNALTIFPFSGKVGMGTLTPSDRLHVFDNQDANSLIVVENPHTGTSAVGALRAKSDVATVNFQAHGSGRVLTRFGQTLGGWAEFLQVNGNGLIIGTLTPKPLILGTNSTNRLQIQGTGEVGIGTAAPASKLHVSGGDVRVTGGSFIDDGVTLNAPDYVFEPDYALMPLAELQAFIAREKHLPNVPSAREVKTQGVNLGQFQMRLLEKIEELTLYTLAQQSDLAALKDENAALRTRLEALEQASPPVGETAAP